MRNDVCRLNHVFKIYFCVKSYLGDQIEIDDCDDIADTTEHNDGIFCY